MYVKYIIYRMDQKSLPIELWTNKVITVWLDNNAVSGLLHYQINIDDET